MSDDSFSAQSRTFPIRALACGRELWLQISNPLAFGLLGLAVAVAVWGYGYKLSLYTVPPGTSSRVPAKLWIEHRYGFSQLSSGIAAPSLKARVEAQHPGAAALFGAVPKLAFQGITGLLSVTVCWRTIPFFHAAIPLRSPPLVLSF